MIGMSDHPEQNPYRPVDLSEKPPSESSTWPEFHRTYQKEWLRWRRRCHLISFASLLMCGGFAWPIIAGWIDGLTLGVFQSLSIASMLLAITTFVFGPISWFWLRKTRQTLKERSAAKEGNGNTPAKSFEPGKDHPIDG